MQDAIRLIECPRDAMQGWKRIIPTEQKIAYINSLLEVGFDIIDFGSFVSPRAIPQMADTKDVVRNLDMNNRKTKLLAIVANVRGAEEACEFEKISYLGFPFSVSETFQKRNANSSMEESLGRVAEIQNLCIESAKEMVVYISMGFGNPYGDPYNEEIVFSWVNKIVDRGIDMISLADTVGLATPEQVYSVTAFMINAFPDVDFGVHLHSTQINRKEKLEAAYKAGCRQFDGALKGIGGCPMANDELVGNMNMEWMIRYFEEHDLLHNVNKEALAKSLRLAEEIFV